MTIVYTPHACGTPSDLRGSLSTRPSEHAPGTIWRCDECGRYWRFRVRKTYLYPAIKKCPRYESDWRLVQSWHLLTVLRIMRAEARGPHWELNSSGRPELTY